MEMSIPHFNRTFYDGDFVKYFNNKQRNRPDPQHGQLRDGRVLARDEDFQREEIATDVKEQKSLNLLIATASWS
jgi:hypothetical protein